ncbi:DUF1758 domain-containing protein [Trichonephila clavata]|uniref:DUF1758 domain-containing protein n=1 Tax=Trichonephila clavata TaxID=2740835 RepID=A0A8X6F952_TRICU|nr:DUF1758 domain-containing protein [Trichonephila clavata]
MLERGIELADNSASERIHVMIGLDYTPEISGERNIRIIKRLIAVDSIFGYLVRIHNVETSRYTRVTFGVKCSPLLLAAVIRLHDEKYVNKYERACEMLNELYVYELINNTSDKTEALELSEDIIHILSEAEMNLRRWATNFTTLHEAWKRVNIDCRETSEESGVPLKILGIILDNVKDNLIIDIKQFEKLNKIVKIKIRVILSACGMLFDPNGIMKPFTIRMKLMLQTMWELGISWDECVPSDIKASFLE